MHERCTRIVHKALRAVRPQFRLAPESPFDGSPDHMRSTGSQRIRSTTRPRRGSPTSPRARKQAGGLEVSPETLKFWTSTVTGGTGTFLADSMRLGELGVRKLAGGEGDLSPDLKEIPIVRRFVRAGDVRDSRRAYWSAAREVERAQENRSRAKRVDDAAGVEKVESSSAAQLESIGRFVRYTRDIGRLRDEIDEIAQDDKLSLGMKRIQVRELEAEEKALYEEAVSEYGLAVQDDRKRKAAR